jgi:transcriptional regulator with PAS, ATPase and Fis domain
MGREGGMSNSTNNSRDCTGFVGKSSVFNSIIESIKTVAPRKSSVVIFGETGTGKEMVARQIHACSNRSKKIFVPVDCASLSGHIFESQLFGHVKGAFTGAIRDTLGFFRAADGGTIFLDEIGEIELELQGKLLRVLQQCCVTPVGSTKSYPADVRVICATNRDLKEMVHEGTFRADLYFRLNVVRMEVPPLKERKKDIPILCEHFIGKQAKLYGEPIKQLSNETIEILKNYSWPGNIRELSNVIEHAYINSVGNVVEADSLPADILTGDLMLPTSNDKFMSFEELEKRLVIRALKTTGGRKMEAARLLKIDHRKLGRLVEKFNLKPTWR